MVLHRTIAGLLIVWRSGIAIVMAVDGRGVEMPEVVHDSAPTVDVIDGTGPRGPSS